MEPGGCFRVFCKETLNNVVLMNPERNRGVPAGIGPEFPERTGIKTGTKTTLFCPGFMNGMACSGHSGRNGTDFTSLLEIQFYA